MSLRSRRRSRRGRRHIAKCLSPIGELAVWDRQSEDLGCGTESFASAGPLKSFQPRPQGRICWASWRIPLLFSDVVSHSVKCRSACLQIRNGLSAGSSGANRTCKQIRSEGSGCLSSPSDRCEAAYRCEILLRASFLYGFKEGLLKQLASTTGPGREAHVSLGTKSQRPQRYVGLTGVIEDCSTGEMAVRRMAEAGQTTSA